VTPPEIDADQLVDAACTSTGIDDAGLVSCRDGLERLVEGLNGEARLSELGAAITPDNLVGYLANRLQVLDWHRSHPELEAAPVSPVVFMIGMGRTGTTILHDLLAQDPANRVPLTWEVDQPIPPPETATYDTDPRIAEAEARADMSHAALPDLQAMHPTGALLAQECVRITGCDFKSVIFGSQYCVPSYLEWVTNDADMAPTYQFHRRYLQVLQSHHHADRWVLKSGAHLWALPALLETYPDAFFVQTHRDPLRAIASLSSLFTTINGMFSDALTMERVASVWAELVMDALDRSVTARLDGSIPADRVVDVQYRAFMADPFTTLHSVYDGMGVELTADADARMRAFLADHGQQQHGVHRYTWADTGLDEGEWRERAARYVDHFGVDPEPWA